MINVLFTGLGSTDYGKNIQSYILMVTWYTQLVRVITRKIGFLPKLPGKYHDVDLNSSLQSQKSNNNMLSRQLSENLKILRGFIMYFMPICY